MVVYKCGNCGFEGHCCGVASSGGVSAPFCAKCGKNNKLIEVIKLKEYPEIIDFPEWDKVEMEYKSFDGGGYFDDYSEAVEYAKINGGCVYTVCDDVGTKVYYSKGSQLVDRLGHCVIKMEGYKDGKN